MRKDVLGWAVRGSVLRRLARRVSGGAWCLRIGVLDGVCGESGIVSRELLWMRLSLLRELEQKKLRNFWQRSDVKGKMLETKND